MKKVQLLRDTEQGTGEYGPTMFSDLTEEEFIEQNLGFYPPKYNPVSNAYESELLEAEHNDVEIPESFDWRDHGAVTPVKNQGKYMYCKFRRFLSKELREINLIFFFDKNFVKATFLQYCDLHFREINSLVTS